MNEPFESINERHSYREEKEENHYSLRQQREEEVKDLPLTEYSKWIESHGYRQWTLIHIYCLLPTDSQLEKNHQQQSGFLITKVYQYCNSRYRNPTYKGMINTMVDGSFIKGYELDFLIGIGLSLLAGFLIGVERESRGKAAGISTHCFVIAGSMIFTYLSAHVDPMSTSRIAAELVAGIGFLGAGMILKSESDRKITNLTTAAAIWFAASIGMAIGFGFYFMAIVGIAFAVLVPRIPHLSKLKDVADR